MNKMDELQWCKQKAEMYNRFNQEAEKIFPLFKKRMQEIMENIFLEVLKASERKFEKTATVPSQSSSLEGEAEVVPSPSMDYEPEYDDPNFRVTFRKALYYVWEDDVYGNQSWEELIYLHENQLAFCLYVWRAAKHKEK